MHARKEVNKMFLMALSALTLLLGLNAQAEVKLENTIQKVETFVNEAGEVERRLIDAASIVPGDELMYVVRFTNQGDAPVDAGSIVITDAIPEHTEYLGGTAFGAGTDVSFSLDGESFAAPAALLVDVGGVEAPAEAAAYRAIRWHFGPALQPGEAGFVSFNVRLK